jgi:hypothetical protein
MTRQDFFPVSFLSNLLLCPLGVGCRYVPQAKETYWFIMVPGEPFERLLAGEMDERTMATDLFLA